MVAIYLAYFTGYRSSGTGPTPLY